MKCLEKNMSVNVVFDKEFQKKFIKEIEKRIKDNADSYVDSVLDVCESYELEPQIAAKFLNKPIIEKLEKEGIENNIIPRKSRLPI